MMQKRWAISVAILVLLFAYLVIQVQPAQADPSVSDPHRYDPDGDRHAARAGGDRAPGPGPAIGQYPIRPADHV